MRSERARRDQAVSIDRRRKATSRSALGVRGSSNGEPGAFTHGLPRQCEAAQPGEPGAQPVAQGDGLHESGQDDDALRLLASTGC